MFTKPRTIALAITSFAAFSWGCGPGSEQGEPQPVDHETTVQSLEENSARLAKSFTRSLEFLEGSKLVDSSAATLELGESGGGCAGGEACDSTTETRQIETDTSGQRKEAIDDLEELVFRKDLVVAGNGTSITYKFSPEVYCEPEASTEVCVTESDGTSSCEGSADSSELTAEEKRCRRRLKKMKYRVGVTRPDSDTVVFRLFVGSQSYNPLVVELSDDHVASEISLSATKKSLELQERVYGTETTSSLPSTFQGRIRAKFERLQAKKVHFELRIKSGLNIGGGDYSFQFASAAKPVFGITADGGNEVVSSTVDLDTIEASFPATHEEYDPEISRTGMAPVREEFQHVLHLAGLSGETTLTGDSDQLEFEKLGLGDGTSWLKMGGEKVVSVDLNAGSGRQFRSTLTPAQNGQALKVEVKPEFDLDMLLKFKRVADRLKLTPEWAMDDHTRVSLSGASPASIVIGPEYVEVLQGVLNLSSSSADIDRSANAGECLVDNEESSSEPSTAEPHPFSYFAVAQCAN